MAGHPPPLVRNSAKQNRLQLLGDEARPNGVGFVRDHVACLENHGYALADAALRACAPELCSVPGAPSEWPHRDYPPAKAW